MGRNRGRGRGRLQSQEEGRRIHERRVSNSARRQATGEVAPVQVQFYERNLTAEQLREQDDFDDEEDMESASIPPSPTVGEGPLCGDMYVDDAYSVGVVHCDIPAPSYRSVTPSDDATHGTTYSRPPQLIRYEGNLGQPSASARVDMPSSSASTVSDEWVVKGRMPGGPSDASVIPSYGGHVARRIWEGYDRGVLNAYARPDSCRQLSTLLSTMKQEAVDLIMASDLSHLPNIMYQTLDLPLISAFVERWQPDTNSFHLPFGEITILLHDVWYLLRIPIEGDLPYDDPQKPVHPASSIEHKLMRLMGYEDQVTFDRANIYVKGGVDVNYLVGMCKDNTNSAPKQAVSWLLAATGVCLFTDKTKTSIKVNHYDTVFTDTATRTSWGAMTLAVLYRRLGQASRFECAGIAGCLTLLQGWIYEYFHCFRPNRSRLPIEPYDARVLGWDVHPERKDFRRLEYFRQRLDALRADEVTWCPYGPDPISECRRTAYHGCIGYYDVVEPYMPDRCIRQLGYVQKIPMRTLKPVYASRPHKSSQYVVRFSGTALEEWEMYGGRNSIQISYYTRCELPHDADCKYMDWFEEKSHPRLKPRTSSSLPISADQTSCDWWCHEFFRVGTSIRSQVANFLPESNAKKEFEALLDQFATLRGLDRG